ncbi:unnamed protein product [Heterobilharzia americana]|nr:unnamed protein product [Heterobilharzia americana]
MYLLWKTTSLFCLISYTFAVALSTLESENKNLTDYVTDLLEQNETDTIDSVLRENITQGITTSRMKLPFEELKTTPEIPHQLQFNENVTSTHLTDVFSETLPEFLNTTNAVLINASESNEETLYKHFNHKPIKNSLNATDENLLHLSENHKEHDKLYHSSNAMNKTQYHFKNKHSKGFDLIKHRGKSSRNLKDIQKHNFNLDDIHNHEYNNKDENNENNEDLKGDEDSVLTFH